MTNYVLEKDRKEAKIGSHYERANVGKSKFCLYCSCIKRG